MIKRLVKLVGESQWRCDVCLNPVAFFFDSIEPTELIVRHKHDGTPVCDLPNISFEVTP